MIATGWTPGVPATADQLQRAWLMEAQFAKDELQEGPRPSSTVSWWAPHLVYVLHLEEEHLYKAGITRHDSRRLRDLTAHGRATIVTTTLVANRWAARLVELDVLKTVEAHRAIATGLGSEHGRHECWLDTAAVPDVAEAAARLEAELALPFWSTTRGGHIDA